MQILSLVNQKGGCGKTTVAVNLCGALASRGKRALLVDLDPQAHATLALGCAPGMERPATPDRSEPALVDVLLEKAAIEDVVLAAAGGVWLVPATARLSEFEEVAARLLQPERILARALESVADVFDFAVLDCPPRADGVLTMSALRASTTAILVVETGAFALQGALQARRILDAVRARDGLAFETRVLATLFDRRLKIAREILVALQARFGSALYDTVIRESARLREAAALGAPVHALDPASRATADFSALAAEILGELPADRALADRSRIGKVRGGDPALTRPCAGLTPAD